jgi:hypothetical protein
MKKLVIVAALPLLLACNNERAISATCTPAVNVTVPSASSVHPKGKTAAAARVRRKEAVQVYWDLSRSMRDFASTRAGTSDDLTPVVAALDSSVLLSAHAKVVEQYGVGESVISISSARAALQPSANRTALHLAAEQIGTALANGSAQAALVISDMELDTPPRTNALDATVCGGVPLPSTRDAGSLFGRCFENAVLASELPPRTRTNLLVHVFRKSTHGRELFILLLATDRSFGRRISDEVARRLDFSRHVIFDSGVIAAANVHGCRLTAATPGVQIKTGGCTAKCFDADESIQFECDLRRPATDPWVYPSGRGIDGVTYESLKKKAGDREEQALVRFAIPCSTPPGRFQATVSFSWRERTPWSRDGKVAFAQKASVRDLFDSLTDAIARTVAPRRLHLGVDLDK